MSVMSHLTGFMQVHLDALYVSLYQLNKTGQAAFLSLCFFYSHRVILPIISYVHPYSHRPSNSMDTFPIKAPGSVI